MSEKALGGEGADNLPPIFLLIFFFFLKWFLLPMIFIRFFIDFLLLFKVVSFARSIVSGPAVLIGDRAGRDGALFNYFYIIIIIIILLLLLLLYYL